MLQGKRQFRLLVTRGMLAACAWGIIACARLAHSGDANAGLQIPAAATQMSRVSSSQLRSWISDLGNEDADVREKATQSLMSLGRDDLPRLRDAALAEHGLLPAQIASLREVVTQVFLETEEYAAAPTAFLGLHWSLPPGGPAETVRDNGVLVSERIPGFSAYRMLRPGDVILKIEEHPDLDLRFQTLFQSAIQMFPPGQVLHFDVLRGGKTIQVAVTLRAIPRELLLPDSYDEWEAYRTKRVDDYWQKTFGDIDPGAAGTATTQP
jgi:C-terminal processing protease CtpA/Prc